MFFFVFDEVLIGIHESNLNIQRYYCSLMFRAEKLNIFLQITVNFEYLKFRNLFIMFLHTENDICQHINGTRIDHIYENIQRISLCSNIEFRNYWNNIHVCNLRQTISSFYNNTSVIWLVTYLLQWSVIIWLIYLRNYLYSWIVILLSRFV